MRTSYVFHRYSDGARMPESVIIHDAETLEEATVRASRLLNGTIKVNSETFEYAEHAATEEKLAKVEAERDALAERLEAAQRIADEDRVDHPVHTMKDGDPVEYVSAGWRTKMGRDLHVALKGAPLVKSLARRDSEMQRAAYLAGWMASSEGHNAEYPGDTHESPRWIEKREEWIRAQQAEGGGS